MQRENKWQDREKYLGRIVDILSYQSAITAQGIKYDGEKDWALNKILDLIDTAIAEERKAFGGCTKCYGKGYATIRYGFNAHADFIGDKSYEYGTKTHMEFCDCDRGEQLKNLIK